MQKARKATEKLDERAAVYSVYRSAAVQAEIGDAKGALEWIDTLRSPRLKADALLGVATGLRKTPTTSCPPAASTPTSPRAPASPP